MSLLSFLLRSEQGVGIPGCLYCFLLCVFDGIVGDHRRLGRRFDTDKSGSIDRQELQTVMDSLGKPVSAADVQEMLVRGGGRV